MPSQLLLVVGPARPEATASLITIHKAKLKDQHLTCEFTEYRQLDLFEQPAPAQLNAAEE